VGKRDVPLREGGIGMPGKCEKTMVARSRSPKRPRRKGQDLSAPIGACLTEEQAVREAGRCLRLRACESCDLCSLLCPDLCITRDESGGDVVIDLDFCKGCGICAAVCPKGAIRMVPEEAA
jgi:2-oxoacid:acceptor oxidoreductase delta subunit (pyruvate/2-ketoisovalerate family)